MGFVILGIFSLTVIGIDGAVFTMVSHPLTTGALFLLVGMIYERLHTREIGEWAASGTRARAHRLVRRGDVRRHRPARVLRVHRRVPVAHGAFIYDRPYAIVADVRGDLRRGVHAVVVPAGVHGQGDGCGAKIKDVNVRELVVVVPLLGLSLFLGIYPKPVLDRIEPAGEPRDRTTSSSKTDYRSPEHAGDRHAGREGRPRPSTRGSRRPSARTGQ